MVKLYHCLAFILVAMTLSSGCASSTSSPKETVLSIASGDIHDAAKHDDLAMVKALLKDNPNLVFKQDENGRTPLHCAALEGHTKAVALLLANKADVNAKDKDGQTPLHLAALSDKDVVALLLANKADVNAKDNDGRTPLENAAKFGLNDVAALLIANKADVNVMDNYGQTPLLWAADQGRVQIAALLLANNADVNAKDKNGRTPLSIAAVEMDPVPGQPGRTIRMQLGEPGSRKDVAELLRQHGGHE